MVKRIVYTTPKGISFEKTLERNKVGCSKVPIKKQDHAMWDMIL